MTAQDYPITFPYGATDDFYYYTPTAQKPKTANWVYYYHRGDDREMEVGTEVRVNGVLIGLSGSMYGGPHLHIGHFVGGKDVNPNGQGFSITGGIVTECKEDATNGKYVRVADADGSSWVYLHLSVNDIISPGTKLEGDDMPNEGDVDNAYLQANGRKATDEEKRIYTSKPWSAPDGLYYGKVRVDFDNVKNAQSGTYEPVTEQLFKKK